jgi:hypothetical protein
MTSRRRRPDGALNHHDQSSLEFGHSGPAILGLGKEALLTRLTTRRSREHHEVIDYIFAHAKQREAYVFTTTHVLAEVIGTIRSGTDPHTVNELWKSIQSSDITVLEDGQEWKSNPISPNGNEVFRNPFDQFDNLLDLYEENPDIDFKFHEGTVVLNSILLEELSRGKSYTVYVATFDGDLASLADQYQIGVLPYHTDLRDDGQRSI